MVDKVKIDIVSDVVCPWCIIGYRNLEKAIEELGIQDQVEIEWQPFELNPDMPLEGENLSAHSARKYGSTPESSAQFRVEMAARGNEVDFSFDYFKEMKIVNTRDCHVLLEYAKEFNLQTELKLRLFSAFFTEHKDVSDREVLVKEAETVGLNLNAVTAQLEDETSALHVQQVESQWQQMGISSVPTVVVNRRNAIAGAQPVEAFKQLLQSAI
ncbi:DsbA family oxidoreductase [uncultured Psychrosphaera sp.]|jgi:predicted DsbA family dithiol-disulfide isomerase|uniref:DsbA family oxidoreductase n=1 Tax=uncultured Psychrosphaera sp. TaxID=1403522 RepID=UPI00260BDAF3|nr:DsbA family oxidoreductase [uncultured Psychrosphaera sp.]